MPARTFAAVAALAIAMGPGCARPGSARLQGRWRGVRAEGVSGDASAAANIFAAQTQISFEGDSMVVLSPIPEQAGRYKVVREDAATVVLVTDADGPSAPQTFSLEGDGTLRWRVLPGKSLVFVRE